jgi:ribosomal 50S subunit-associated protein YjgA (DUF615 family)
MTEEEKKEIKMARTRQKWDSETERAVRSLDALAEFEEFCEGIIPELRRPVLENWSPEKMRREFASRTQAQIISKALRGDVRAIRDVLDRLEGKPIKREENRRVYARMDKRELAALCLQKLKDAGMILTDGCVVTPPNRQTLTK